MLNQVIDTCESTNDLARELARSGAPHGSWVSARRQTKGRGRMGREWVSLDSNLFLSMIFRAPVDRSRAQLPVTWVPLLTAIGAAEALEPWAHLEIKWPNDLWMAGAKVGGILCEAFGTSDGSVIVAGLGINGLRAPTGLDQEARAIGVSADVMRGPVIEGIRAAWERLLTDGMEWIAPIYEQRAVLRNGSQVTCSDFQGQVVGLGSFGELCVRVQSGEVRAVFAEDVSLVREKKH